jgi:hypothetical protein
VRGTGRDARAITVSSRAASWSWTDRAQRPWHVFHGLGVPASSSSPRCSRRLPTEVRQCSR